MSKTGGRGRGGREGGAAASAEAAGLVYGEDFLVKLSFKALDIFLVKAMVVVWMQER
jgi:hypothetical protein